MSEAWRLYDTSGDIRPNAIAADSGMFEALRAYERDARQPRGRLRPAARSQPRVALRPSNRPRCSRPRNSRARERRDARDASGELQRGDKVRRLPVDIESLTAGSGEPHGDRMVYYTAKASAGTSTRSTRVYPKPEEGTGDLPELAGLAAVERSGEPARARSVGAPLGRRGFVIGPTDDALVPCVFPRRSTPQQCARCSNPSTGAWGPTAPTAS